MNWALLLITEAISLLDLWKYANSMLICTSNDVPFNVWQSGTFTPYETGKLIQCGASKWVEPRGLWRNNSVWGWHVTQHKSMFIDIHEWLLKVWVSLQRTAVEMCWKYVLCLPSLSKEQKARGCELFHQVSLEMCDVYREYVSSVNLHNVSFSGIKKNNFYF